MKFLRCSIIILLLASCSSAYKGLQPIAVDENCVAAMKPSGIATTWFDTSVDIIGKHISGLLLIKEMPDSSTRVVFTNEAGVTFFDFAFGANGSFTKMKIIKQLDKKPVIQTLQKDFSLMLGIPFKAKVDHAMRRDDENFYGVNQKNETAYFITDKDCASLQRLELGSKRKRKVTIALFGNRLQPDSMVVKHYTFDMEIRLKKIDRN